QLLGLRRAQALPPLHQRRLVELALSAQARVFSKLERSSKQLLTFAAPVVEFLDVAGSREHPRIVWMRSHELVELFPREGRPTDLDEAPDLGQVFGHRRRLPGLERRLSNDLAWLNVGRCRGWWRLHLPAFTLRLRLTGWEEQQQANDDSSLHGSPRHV